ncbi:MAG: Asp-tRNA(Asn)/Glu-tRNA(Gln) amidotransferase subunit GatA [Rickettsiales bacterium]|jgi:aspartyl-tRNA(Asn)/glutamyl-tRNA(Gln) amidotransferase subunit A|nr:Asp-tRNA(Asn)/Glu-tRNA(Gln) amidotransferase subunit GatA [Rickettsiales bacterium]
MSELLKLTLLQARERLLNREVKSIELVDAFIENIERNRHLNAFILDTFEHARERAKVSDSNLSNRTARKLEGLPMGVKDVFCTKGIRTTACSKILSDFIPPYESTVTQKLSDENYIMLGKTNTDEFTCGSTTATSCFGPSVSPYRARGDDRDLIPGGSSGGSSAAMAANLCLAALGTDTGGSVRQPAALCNLVGLKPTYGRISRYGVVAYASSFDQTGTLTKNIEDAAYLMDIVCGHDEKDSTSHRGTPTHFYENLRPAVESKKIGVIKQFLGLDDKVDKDIYDGFYEVLDMFRRDGYEIIEISIPTIDYVPELYTVLSYTELASNLARYDGVRYGHRSKEKLKSLEDLYLKSKSEGFCDNIKKRILLGYFFSSSENYEKFFLKAQKVRRKLANEFLAGLSQISFIMTPATPQTAFPFKPTEAEKLKNMESNYLNDLFVCPVNMVGLPGLVVPIGFDHKDLPMGVHLIGKHFDEQTILNAGLFIEKNGSQG